MKTVYPQPGHVEGELHSLLATKKFVFADTITIEPKAGDPLRYCSTSRTVEVVSIDDEMDNPGTTVTKEYFSDRVKVSGIQSKSGIGIEVDEQKLRMDYTPDDVYYGMSFAEAIKRGRFDGSVIKRDRYFAADWNSRGRRTDFIAGVRLFQGRFSNADSIGRSFAEFSVKSNLLLLNMKMPTRKYQPTCNHVFGDPGCGFDRSSLSVSSATLAGSDSSTLLTADADASHKWGTVEFEDAFNVLQIRTVKSVDPGVSLTLAYPLDFPPSTGELFVIKPGCNRTYEGEDNNCDTYWGSAKDKHFLGFPFVPVPETAI